MAKAKKPDETTESEARAGGLVAAIDGAIGAPASITDDDDDDEHRRCEGCGELVLCEDCADSADGEPVWCHDCRDRYPDDLRKAVTDPFDYECRLADGMIVRFQQALIESGDWVCLVGDGEPGERSVLIRMDLKDHPFKRFPRGLTVRLETITWIADAPEGS